MTTLITGGSKCGKSSLAERILDGFHGRKFYIAAMQPFGDDAFEAIERHRKMRQGKGFETIEKYTDLHELSFPADSAALLECVGNLCANEMFRDNEVVCPIDAVLRGIRSVSESVSELVIVTNQVGSDGIAYSEETSRYIRYLGEINRCIAGFADNVIECVYGIPLLLKGELSC